MKFLKRLFKRKDVVAELPKGKIFRQTFYICRQRGCKFTDEIYKGDNKCPVCGNPL